MLGPPSCATYCSGSPSDFNLDFDRSPEADVPPAASSFIPLTEVIPYDYDPNTDNPDAMGSRDRANINEAEPHTCHQGYCLERRGNTLRRASSQAATVYLYALRTVLYMPGLLPGLPPFE